jgi:Domain of unknown function (DUF4349)
MVIEWGMFSTKSRKALRTGWLITAGLVALYVGFIQPQERCREIAEERGTGLAAVARVGWEPRSLWRQRTILPRFTHEQSVDQATIGGVPGDITVRPASMAMTYLDADKQTEGGGREDAASDRKLVRTATISLIVESPAKRAEEITHLAEGAGGFLVSSQLNGGADAPVASLAIRVPAAKFEGVRAQIRQLGLRLEAESVDAQDVTRQYVDQEARLRNLRAEEQQYLGILRKAVNVKDTLEVSGKLDEVRGATEERQAEFRSTLQAG